MMRIYIYDIVQLVRLLTICFSLLSINTTTTKKQHNNIEALLKPTGAFVDKLVEFLDLHVSARRGRIRPPVIVPECVPAALREFGVATGATAIGGRAL